MILSREDMSKMDCATLGCLSTGLKTGIGIAIAVTVLAIIFCGAWPTLRRCCHKRHAQDRKHRNVNGGEGDGNAAVELGNMNQRAHPDNNRNGIISEPSGFPYPYVYPAQLHDDANDDVFDDEPLRPNEPSAIYIPIRIIDQDNPPSYPHSRTGSPQRAAIRNGHSIASPEWMAATYPEEPCLHVLHTIPDSPTGRSNSISRQWLGTSPGACAPMNTPVAGSGSNRRISAPATVGYGADGALAHGYEVRRPASMAYQYPRSPDLDHDEQYYRGKHQDDQHHRQMSRRVVVISRYGGPLGRFESQGSSMDAVCSNGSE